MFYEIIYDENGLLQEAFEISFLQIPKKFRANVIRRGYAKGYHTLFLRKDKMEKVFSELFEKKNEKYLQWCRLKKVAV